jgi:hypothetical protein
MMVEWHQKFHSRQQGTSDEACSSHAHAVTTPKNAAKVEDVLYVLEGV